MAYQTPGFIETSTKRSPDSVKHYLTYDHRYGLWRASAQLALKDLKAAGRENFYEFI